MALAEEMIYDQGRLLNASFRDYKMLTAMDSLPVEPGMVPGALLRKKRGHEEVE